MSRPLAFDLTHLVTRLPVKHPSGIDKVDLAYARHFATAPCDVAVHYGLRHPRFHARHVIAQVAAIATGSRWVSTAADQDGAYRGIYQGLTGQLPGCAATPLSPSVQGDAWTRRRTFLKWRFSPGSEQLAERALYLNVAQHAFEFPRFFQWLDERPDVLSVFLVHDLLPLDYPEYFRGGYEQRFRQRWQTIARHGRALITTTDAVRQRVLRELAADGRPPVPVLVAPLPSSLPDRPSATWQDPALQASPYFVVLGTIEPRKNHLTLLNIWRRMAELSTRPPKLVIVGARGWENEQVLDVLDRSERVRPHVIEASGVGDEGLARLIANANALLMPSFAEGYGLPVVEALSLGTPVVASDLPVFHEVSQERAIFRHPIDGSGWLDAIHHLSDPTCALARQARDQAQAFIPPTWPNYFRSVDTFLAGL